MSNNSKEKKSSFFDIIKNFFWLLIFLQFAPVLFSSLKNTLEDIVSPKTHIGLLNLNGLITDSTFYVKNIQKFLKSPQIKALLVKVNSPGGFPGSSQAIFNELNKFKTKKPVVAFIENMGTSGAYNVAIACNHIVSSPSALVGNIGVWLQVPPNVKELAEDWKIKFRNIYSGSYKTSGSPFKEMTAAERQHLPGVSDDTYNQFVNDVAQSRNLSLKNHLAWADGKVFTGNQALKLKLVDQLGSQQDAIDEIKKQAMIETEVKLIQPRRPSGFMRMFGAQDGTDSDGSFSSLAANFITEVMDKVSVKTETTRLK